MASAQTHGVVFTSSFPVANRRLLALWQRAERFHLAYMHRRTCFYYMCTVLKTIIRQNKSVFVFYQRKDDIIIVSAYYLDLQTSRLYLLSHIQPSHTASLHLADVSVCTFTLMLGRLYLQMSIICTLSTFTFLVLKKENITG